MTWAPSFTQDELEEGTIFEDEDALLRTWVFQALGAASTCWESLEGAGTFDSTRAQEIGDSLIAFIKEHRPVY